MMLYVSMKFHENILNGFQVIERTRFCDGSKDRRTNNQGKMSPSLSVGGEGGVMWRERHNKVTFPPL